MEHTGFLRQSLLQQGFSLNPSLQQGYSETNTRLHLKIYTSMCCTFSEIDVSIAQNCTVANIQL